ncbi:MAG: permease-like cell division protein FtsX [Bacteroidota bacterium]
MARQGGRNTSGFSISRKPNYVYSIVSVALVLFLLGFFGLLILHAQELVRVFKENVNLMVEVKANTTKTAIYDLQRQLAKEPYVKPGSIVFTSKESAVDLLREELGEDFMKLGFVNPLYDAFTFNLRASHMQRDSLIKIKQALKSEPLVSDVHYQEGIVDGLSENIERVSWLALAIGLLFLLIAISLIHNTIKLALYANRFLIKNMELVGASWGFISRPYLWRSLMHGFLSGLLAVGALILLLFLAQQDLPDLKQLEDIPRFAILFGALILLGILITSSSTYYVVNKYLQMRVDDLY